MAKCDNCGRDHVRKRFCSNKCKDRFHNRARAAEFLHSPLSDDQQSEIAELAGSDYGAGWDEDGWRDDDSGVSAF
jgi:hypothetical protein